MSTPICRCRVLYLGSAVPHITKDGLQGIQEPLRELYPDEGVVVTRGIDSWLSVWSNGLLLENVDEHGKRLTRFFPVDSLHYCAAVRHVGVPGGATGEERVARFLPLDSPFARVPNAAHPPLFACILRRTTGIKVLECHAFVCKKEMAANALVRCCFHSYADSMYARQLENGYVPSANGNAVTGPDDVSIYNSNGVDDNHKIWTGNSNGTGSNGTANGTTVVATVNGNGNVPNVNGNNNGTAERESPLYSSLRSDGSKSNEGPPTSQRQRPRQMVSASKLPPPPNMVDEGVPSSSPMNMMNAMMTNGSRHHHHHHHHQQQQQNHHQHQNHHHHNNSNNQHHYHNGTAPKKGAKNSKGRGGPPPPPPPMNGYSPKKGGSTPRGHVYHLPPPHMLVGRPLPPYIMARSAEEPTYMPSTRPISPVASYQPMAFPYDRYLMHQHMGSQPRPSTNKSGGKKQRSSPSSKGHHHHHGSSNGTLPMVEAQRPHKDEANGDAGKFSTGIYRKKGHLNERAFSYSIRQEHRSRSHSSLATLAFNGNGHAAGGSPRSPPPPVTMINGGSHEANGHLAHMVSEISLSEDETDDEMAVAAAPAPASASGSR